MGNEQVRQYPCPDCTLTFDSEQTLQTHWKTHFEKYKRDAEIKRQEAETKQEPEVVVIRRGLASASPEVRRRVAQKGGNAKHKIRGLAAASKQKREHVARLGGNARSKDIESLRISGRLGGMVMKEKYGESHFSRIGKMGGTAVHKLYGKSYYSNLGKKGGRALADSKSKEYFISIGKKGGEVIKNKMKVEREKKEETSNNNT